MVVLIVPQDRMSEVDPFELSGKVRFEPVREAAGTCDFCRRRFLS